MSVDDTVVFLAATLDDMLTPILSELAAQLDADLSSDDETIFEIAEMLEREMRLADIDGNELDAYKAAANCIYWFNRLKPIHLVAQPKMKHLEFVDELIAFQMGILMIDLVLSHAGNKTLKQDNIGDALFQQILRFLRYKDLSVDGIYLFLRAAFVDPS